MYHSPQKASISVAFVSLIKKHSSVLSALSKIFPTFRECTHLLKQRWCKSTLLQKNNRHALDKVSSISAGRVYSWFVGNYVGRILSTCP